MKFLTAILVAIAVSNCVNADRFYNQQTERALDSNGAKAVYTHSANGGLFQSWTVIKEDDYFLLKNDATGYCLLALSSIDSLGRGEVIASECSSPCLMCKRWYRKGYQWVNPGVNKCLDSDDFGNVYAIYCNGKAWQNWMLYY